MDVFLSYARANAKTAKQVATALREEGYSVWFDEHLPAHRAYSEVIEEQLDAAGAVIVLWSDEAVRSQWVRSEANRARETGRLVQVRLDDARLPMPFDQIQCADLRKWRGDAQAPAWQGLITSVAALVTNGGAAEAKQGRSAHPSLPFIRRRQFLVAAGAMAALGGAGFLGWKTFDEPRISPQAQMLLERGLAALQDNDALDPQGPGSTMQAIALLTDATEAAPDSAMAWGGLAMAYAVRKRVAPLAERPGLEMRSRAAARNALQIDPNEPRALGALRLVEPVYRNWLAAERGDRAAVKKNPNLPILLFIMSGMLGNVGRWKDARTFSGRYDRQKFLIPGADRKVVVDLWASGDLPGADRALAAAIEQWPQHPQLWRTRLAYLMYSGRAREALELLRDDADRPTDVSSDFLIAHKAIAEALASQREPSDAVHQAIAYLSENPTGALDIASAAAALGDPDTAFRILDGYYFGEGDWASLAPKAGDDDRVTGPLFQPPMRNLWSDHRFDPLLERIGLNDYWRRSKTVPDFRRAT